MLEDADLDKAIKWAVWGKTNKTGQSCVAPKRYIVLDKLADQFLNRFKMALDTL